MQKQILAFILFAVTAPSCKARRFNNSKVNMKRNSESPLRFDVNDLSVLYPPAGYAPSSLPEGKLQIVGLDVNHVGYAAEGKGGTVNAMVKKGFWPALVLSGTQNSNMLSELELNSGIHGFLPRELLAEILESAPGGKSKGGSQLLRLGNRTGDPKWVSVNLSEPDRWRVTSFRFDPCPQKLNMSHSKKTQGGDAILALTQTPEESVCAPELRLVAQPIVGKTAGESRLGFELPKAGSSERISTNPSRPAMGWYFADYGIHLFYSLRPQQAKSFAQNMLALKSKNEDLCPTSEQPLTVHPCLSRMMMAEVDDILFSSGIKEISRILAGNVDPYWKSITPAIKATWKKITFADDVANLYRNNMTALTRIAFFISTRNETPWIGSQFRVENQHLLTDLMPALDPKGDAVLNGDKSKPVEIEPLKDLSTFYQENIPSPEVVKIESEELSRTNDRKALVFSRSNAITDSTLNKFQSNLKSRLFKLPKPNNDSLDAFLRTARRFQSQATYLNVGLDGGTWGAVGRSNISVTGRRNTDLSALLRRIENPRFNNDSTVDCASCHMANMENSALFKTDNLGPSDFAFYSWNSLQSLEEKIQDLKTMSEKTSSGRPFEMSSVPGVTAHTLPAYQTSGDKGENAYILNQFSIYRETPIVSNRVVNETALSVYITNKWYLNAPTDSRHDCDSEQLKLCVQNLVAGSSSLLSVSQSWIISDMFNWRECMDPKYGICKN